MADKKLVCVCNKVVAATLVSCFLFSIHVALSLPLSARSHWLVAQPSGSRVKLSCVNWASHLTPMIAEGLHLHPLHSIAHSIASWGFNCVRLSYATSMFTNSTLAEARVAHIFRELGLEEELHGLARFNGKLVGMTSVEAFKEVVGALGREGLMVVLDNCARTPGRGCSGVEADESYRLLGNSGSEAQEIWVQGLQTVASLFKGWPNVVGVSFRYELQSDPQEWRRQMQRGAEAIHEKNPDLLVFLGGLSSTQDIPFLEERLLSHTLQRKLVYEVQYKISNTYIEGGMEAQCEALVEKMMKDVGFLTTADKSYPSPLLIVGEFGGKHRPEGSRANDAPCFSPFIAHGDLNWAAWPLQGSYYLRGGVQDDDEVFGLFNHHWTAPRNSLFLHKRQALQLSSIQANRWHKPHMVLFHPATGLCVSKVHMKGLQMGSCNKASYWKLTPQGLIALESSYMVISAEGPGQPAVLSLQGLQSNGPWTLSSSASVRYLRMSTVVSGQTLCLDAPSPAKLLTNQCLCSDSSCTSNLTSQCFIFVSST